VTGWLVRRCLEVALVMLLVSLAVYALIGLMPGDPIDLMLRADPHLTAADVARLKALEGLDRPLLERWLRWLGRLLSGDLGYSRLYSVPVREILLPRLGSTLLLTGTAFVLGMALAIPAGVWAAARAGSAVDHVVGVVTFAGISVPTFWLALVLILLFAVELGWLPASGQPEPGAGPLASTRHLVLPVATLTLAEAASLTRFVRAAVLETLGEPFIRTARAMGVGPLRVLLRHAPRPAMLPVVTVLALEAGSLLSGALVVETVFARLGMGRLIYDAIMGNDYNLALAGLLLATLATALCNLAADLAYARLDPRIALDAR
jgi:peptide/nickel transport system permease protein